MWVELTEVPIYTERVGPVSAKVYLCDGVYSLFIVGDTVACFLGNCNSLEDCQEEIKSLGALAKALETQVHLN